MENNVVIVIGRQFGSGGRQIGKKIASLLGIDYYDTELLRKAAESEGLDPQIFMDRDEKKPSVLKHILQGIYGIADNFHTVPISSESTYRVQSQVIKEICRKGPCVIVGRNADVILRGNENLLSVFLHAPLEWRAKRIMQRKEAMTMEEALEMARHHDRRRESFYNFFTGDKRWGVADNYDFALDTSSMPAEEIARLIISLAQKKIKNKVETRSVAARGAEESPGNKG